MATGAKRADAPVLSAPRAAVRLGGGFAAELTVVKPVVAVQFLLLHRGDRAAVTVAAVTVDARPFFPDYQVRPDCSGTSKPNY